MVNPIGGFSSLVMQRTMRAHQSALQQSLSHLATGQRINSGADDPAGLISSTQLDETLAQLDAQTNANERASNIADTADAALGQVSDLLTQAKTLAAANANDAGLSPEEKAANQLEIDVIVSSVDHIAQSTNFNGQKLLDGSGSISIWNATVKIDPSSSSNLGKTSIDSTNYTLADVKSGKGLDTTDATRATNASQVIDSAIYNVATIRAKIGAFSANNIQSNLRTLSSDKVQLTQAVSMIRDTDYAAETSRQVREQLLGKSSMLLLKQSLKHSFQQAKGKFLDLFA